MSAMSTLTDAQKLDMANKAAAVMFTSVSGVPNEIQLEASIILLRTLFVSHVRPTHRLSLFGSVVQRLRKELKENLQTGVKP
jgi:hypothetical protein